MKITMESLKALEDPQKAGERVHAVVTRVAGDLTRLVRFIGRYAAWNGMFGSGVAALAGKIGRSPGLFVEEGHPAPIADRSVLVASYFFDAARDEFDDRETKHRDTHRCLAQATLYGLVEFARDRGGVTALGKPGALETLCERPLWLDALRTRVASGYGVGLPDDRPSIFRAIGYHLGSEVLADREFTILDETLRTERGPLVEDLLERQVTIAGQPHKAYQWIRIHSGLGGGAEADHFAWAVRGAHLAFGHTPAALHDELRRQLDGGYLDFARDHREFFARADEDPLP